MLDVDPRSLNNYQNREIDPLPVKVKGKRGTGNTYDAYDVMKWRIRRELEKVNAKGGDILDYEAERARLTHGQANKVEMETAVMRGELIPAEVVAHVQSDMVGRARARLLSIPTKAAHAILGITELNEAKDVLKEFIYEALTELADYQPEHYGVIADLSQDQQNMDAAS